MDKKDRITKQKLAHYKLLSTKAFKEIRKNINPGKKNQAKEIIEMVKNYLDDSEYFEKKGNFVNAFAALNYAHGWIDSGVRLEIFDVKDNKLFTIK